MTGNIYNHQGTKAPSFTKKKPGVSSCLGSRWLSGLVAKFTLLFFVSCLLACKKDDPPQPPVSLDKYENGVLILNEGLYQQNNSSLCFYSFDDQQVYTQTFFTENNRGLGDTGNDMVKYTLDGKTYILIVVDISSQVEIVEATTLKSVAQIPLFDGSSAREPRHAEVYGSTAFVCSFDGTVSVIDLHSNTITSVIEVGANPDGMQQVGSKLYVSNSGGLNFPVYDSTMTVIDMDSKAVTSTFETRINSISMVLDSQQEIYLLSAGNHMDIEPALLRINTSSNTVVQQFDQPISSIEQVGDWLYYYDTDAKAVKRFNMIDEVFENTIFIDCAGVETFYGLQYEENLGLFFCFDAEGYVNSSTVRAYDHAGVLQFEFTAELNARKMIYNE